MHDCIFCKIISGDVSAYRVYEDETVLAFLDIHPIRPGHTLVIPKTHNPNAHHLSEFDYDAVMRAAKNVALRIEKQLHPKRVGMLVAGWDVPHAHIHVVPMEEYHDLTSKVLLDGTRGNPSSDELLRVKNSLAF